jgi:uncharacterized protein with von Willebrand factor type A (vWA) domain
LLVHSETHYDAYDVAFITSFGARAGEAELVEALSKELDAWLKDPAAFQGGMGEHQFANLKELMEAFQKTLEQQEGRHEGGNRWVGTGGTSPWGSGGRANMGLSLAGPGGGSGGRSGVRIADERAWKNYRTDVPLDVRGFKVALRALRDLARIGDEKLDLDDTIRATAKNAGEIDLIFRPDKKNRVRVALFMDSGGSMEPSAELVSKLFTAAKETKTFKTFEHYYFHNCVYRWLYTDYENSDRAATEQVLEALTPQHRLIFVGDASMASWELFTPASYGDKGPSGLERLTMFADKCAASVWLNPDPPRFWNHPTVAAIRRAFRMRMYPLTLDGLRESVQYLRAPR